MIHYYCSCPTGWKADAKDMVKIARLAVETGIFPLYEVFGGERVVMSHTPAWLPVADYVSLQGRFSHLTKEQIAEFGSGARARFDHLVRLAGGRDGPGGNGAGKPRPEG